MPLKTGKKRVDLCISGSIRRLFNCPISLQVMKDPLTLFTGMSYDRASIENWLEDGNNVCPATLEVLHSKELIPNHILHRLIQESCVPDSPNGVIGIATPNPTAEPGSVQQMIQDIHDATTDKLETLNTLRILANVSERKGQFFKSEGVLPVLIHVLDLEAPVNSLMDADREAVEEAIRAISMFSADDISNKRDLLTPSLLTTLERALVKCTLEARMNAESIVKKLANDRNSAKEITRREGIIDGLLKLFDENIYSSSIKASLKALFPLFTVTKNRAKIAKAGVVPRLIELLPSADTSMAEQSLAILEALSTIPEGRCAILGHALAIPSIVRSLLAVSDTGTNYAVGILLKICSTSPGEGLLIESVRMGSLERLLFLLQMDCSPRTKQKANELIRIISPMRHKGSCNHFSLKL